MNDMNGMKNELVIKPTLAMDTKKIQTKNIAKKGAVLTDNSHKIVVNKTTNIVLTSKKEIALMMGTAQQITSEPLMDELRTELPELLEKSFEDVPPLYLATFGTKEWARNQKNIFINRTEKAALKRQAIQLIGNIIDRDYALLQIIDIIYNLCLNELLWNYSTNIKEIQLHANDGSPLNKANNEDIVYNQVQQKMKHILDKIKIFENQHGEIQYNMFENLMINNIISHDGNCHKPVSELICKLFYSQINDKSRNAEYEKQDINLRMQNNRSEWTTWFSKDKYNGTFVEELLMSFLGIINKMPYDNVWRENGTNYKFYYSITKVGKIILNSLHSDENVAS